MRALFLGLAVLLPAAASAEDCTASVGGSFSFTVGVALGAGGRALYDVDVYAGGTCAGDPVWATQVGSHRRLAVTDGGVLVQLLAPRASRRAWPIIELRAADLGERTVRLASTISRRPRRSRAPCASRSTARPFASATP